MNKWKNVYIYVYTCIYTYTYIYTHVRIYIYTQHNLWVKKHFTIIAENYLKLIGKMPFVSEFMRLRAVFKSKLQLSMHFLKSY